MKVIVITGSTRGIGFGLARSFLELGCAVVVSGRTGESVARAVSALQAEFPADRILGQPCDVTDFAQVQALWDATQARFGRVDIWINNAGVANPLAPLWEHPPERLKSVVETNVLGTLYGAKVALAGMQAQGYGQVFNLEGFGSTGRTMPGMTLYGSTKRAVRYITRSLAEEVRDTPILVGSLRPGMTLTDLITAQRQNDPQQEARMRRILNILGDRVETVTPFLTRKALANRRNGAQIVWLTPGKVLWRFLLARFRRRNIFGEG